MNFRDQGNNDERQQPQFGYYGDRDEQYQKSGYGIMIFPTRATYRGHWKSDKMDGKGVYDWADGNRYEGEFMEGKQCGYGVYTWPSGGKYFGYWENDKMSGRGVYIRHDGVVYEGYWQNDHQVGWGIKRVPEQVCSSPDGKMTNEKAIQEYWTEDHKVLIYFEKTKKSELTRRHFVDVVVRCRDGESDSDEEVDEDVLLEEEEEVADKEGIMNLLSVENEGLMLFGKEENQVILKEQELMRHFSRFGKGFSHEERRNLRAFLLVVRERAKRGAKEVSLIEKNLLHVRKKRTKKRVMKRKGKKMIVKVEKKPKRYPEIDPRSILNFKKFIRYLKSKQKGSRGKRGRKEKRSCSLLMKEKMTYL